ncbi:tetratricopeptide repeat protein [Nonomuraea soli]|uniref:Tetratricopeptide (TPR) repeat protein n=1 Tax=Nonomuraea soli TaxID=1032476 RepID=A0A7W0CIZ9_9ACTN|nr:tetratricopeptide repeat protein [Nonomuraea soli]MBA2892063.1 tetratricopeptide (TPR) repeat protein [Nonomuraea soli]
MTDAPGSDLVSSLATWLAAHLAATGLGLEAAARDLGVSEVTVRSWLAGRRADEEAGEFAHLDTPAKLGAWLRERIAAAGCSVRQIADDTDGVSMSTIYYWLRGDHLPRPPVEDEPDRFDLLLSNPRLGLHLRQRLQLDHIRRRLTGTALDRREPDRDWPARALPAGNRSFTGRGAELRRLDRLLRDHARGRSAVIAALTGPGGVGKTALAVHWARTRHVQTTFTDGCLYLNLNGYADTAPTRPAEAMTRTLVQLGVQPRDLPDDHEALAALYQQTLAARRLLLVLDNTHDEAQARPLLPTGSACLTIVTSRHRLPGLAATHPGIDQLELANLTIAEAASLLRRLLGRLATRDAGEDDLAALAAACGRLPLALHIAAAGYLTHHHPRHTSVAAYTRSLTEDPLRRLATSPADPATTVAVAMDHSYRHLTGEAARAYRLLGLHPGPDFTAAVTASLTARPLARARALLLELAQANLLTGTGTGTGTATATGRHAFHDLVRDHAAARCADTDPDEERRAAVDRILDHYLRTAHGAALLLNPYWEPTGSAETEARTGTESEAEAGAKAKAGAEAGAGVGVESEAEAGAAREVFADHGQAAAWFADEHPVLLAAIELAGDTGRDAHAWRLAWSMTEYLDRLGLWHELAAAGSAASAAAERLGDDTARYLTHRILARATMRLGRLDDSDAHLRHVLDLATRLRGERGQAHAHLKLADLRELQGRFAEALEHAGRANDLWQAAGYGLGQARALNAIGRYQALLGDYDRALALSRRSLELCETLGFGYGEASVWGTFGYIRGRLGQHDEAIAAHRRALGLYRELGDRYEMAESLGFLGDLHQAAGDLAAAREAWHEALAIFTDLDHPDAGPIRAKLGALPGDGGSHAVHPRPADRPREITGETTQRHD